MNWTVIAAIGVVIIGTYIFMRNFNVHMSVNFIRDKNHPKNGEQKDT